MKISIKKKKKPKLQELFIENCLFVEEAFYSMEKAIGSYLNRDFDQAIEKTNETIEIEKKQDRSREEIISRLFSRETMVFSRSDRLSIVESLDRIADKIEIALKNLIIHRCDISPELKEGIIKITKLNSKIGKEVKELVIAIFEDFSKGKEHVEEITNLRREVRSIHWDLLEKNYSVKQDFKDFNLQETLIKNLGKVADRAEEFADQIYNLLCKYSS
ncbi:MAG: DUF47 domain-containing protein [Candidatus Heimdallarchaeaceae archaeon]